MPKINHSEHFFQFFAIQVIVLLYKIGLLHYTWLSNPTILSIINTVFYYFTMHEFNFTSDSISIFYRCRVRFEYWKSSHDSTFRTTSSRLLFESCACACYLLCIFDRRLYHISQNIYCFNVRLFNSFKHLINFEWHMKLQFISRIRS